MSRRNTGIEVNASGSKIVGEDVTDCLGYYSAYGEYNGGFTPTNRGKSILENSTPGGWFLLTTSEENRWCCVLLTVFLKHSGVTLVVAEL